MKVKCPNCMKSSNVINGKCENCRFDIYEYIKTNIMYNDNYNIDQYVFICPHCGTIDAGRETIRLQCYVCGTPYKVTDMLRSEYWDNIYINEKERALIHQYVGDTIDWDIYNDRENKWNNAANHSQNNNQQNIPKCPTCQSTNIKKISATSKATNAVLFGLFGNKRNKQFHCNSCGYEW